MRAVLGAKYSADYIVFLQYFVNKYITLESESWDPTPWGLDMYNVVVINAMLDYLWTWILGYNEYNASVLPPTASYNLKSHHRPVILANQDGAIYRDRLEILKKYRRHVMLIFCVLY